MQPSHDPSIKRSPVHALSAIGGRIVAALAIAWLAGCGGGAAAGPATGGLPAVEDTRAATLTARADALIEAQVDGAGPGIDVRVVKDGQVIYARSKGLADVEGRSAIGPSTAFQVASVAKPMTAVAVMQLVEQKRLSLDDSILKWLPTLPPTWHAMTVRHLLTHRSGIPDCCTNIPLASLAGLLEGVDNAQLVQRHVRDDTLSFWPGSSARYSNSGYVMLAEIIAAASGERFPDYMRSHVFVPAGMRSTWVFGSVPPADAPLARSNGTALKTYGITFALTGPFNVFSTADDLLAFAAALRDGRLLSGDSLRQMTADQSRAKVTSQDANYGFGWFVPAGGIGMTTFAHPGEMDGYMARLHVGYVSGLVIAMVGNGGVPIAQLMNALQSAVLELYGDR